MHERHVEDDFVPTTPTEIVLLERIRELRRILWAAHGPFADQLTDPNTESLDLKALTVDLHMAGGGEVTGEPESMRLMIKAQTCGPLSLGFAHYVQAQNLVQMLPGTELMLFDDILKHATRLAAKKWQSLIEGTADAHGRDG